MSVGDEVVCFEIDSALPLADERFAFLEPRGAKTFEDGRLAEVLGVVKYEAPIPAGLSGEVRGAFPAHLVMTTDAERVQNPTDVYDLLLAEGSWVATEKIDGSSVTYIITGDEADPIRVCSRNWELEPKPELTSMQIARRYDLAALPAGTIVQGELYGEGIQSNPLRIKGTELAVFGVFADGAPVPRDEWPGQLAALGAPVLDWAVPGSVAEAVAQVDGVESVVSPGRKAEGVVWHERSGRTFDALGGRSCWKAISNRYLIKKG